MSTVSAVSISEDARLRVMAARIVAQSRWPYLATLLFNLKIKLINFIYRSIIIYYYIFFLNNNKFR